MAKQYRGGILDIRGGRIDCDDRRVVRRGDTDQCRRHIAVVYSVIDDNFDDAVSRDRIVASAAEADRLQRSLVFSERSEAGEREDAGTGIVAGRGDRSRQRPADRQQIADLRVRQRDRRGSDIRAADIGDGGIGVCDRHRAPFSVNVVR